MKSNGTYEISSERNTGGNFKDLSLVIFGTFAVFAISMLLLLDWSGVPIETSSRTAILISLNTISFGLLWTLWRRSTIDLSEFLAAGVLGSIGLLLISALVVPNEYVAWVQWILPAALAISICGVAGKAKKITPAIQISRATLAAALFAAVGAIYLNRSNFTRYSLVEPIDFSTFHPDLLFHQSVVNAITESGAAQNGLMANWPIRYHWFSHAMASSLELSIRSEPFFALTRVLPILSILVIALLASTWAHSLTRSALITFIAAATVTMGKFVGDAAGVQVNWDSPSQTLSTAFLLFAGYLSYLIVARTKRVTLVPIVIVTAFILAGLKFSSSLVFLAGLVALTLYVYLRQPQKRLVVLSLLIGSVVAISSVYLVWLGGQTDSGGLELRNLGAALPNPLQDSALAITLALLPGWLGLAYLLRSRPTNWWMPTTFAIGAALGGLVPLWALRVEGPNSLWFLTSATSIVWIISIAGAGHLVTRFGQSHDVSALRIFLLAFVASILSVSMWGFIQTELTLNSALIQVLFLLVMVLVVMALGLIHHLRNGGTGLKTISVFMVATGVLIPLAINWSNALFPFTLPRDNPVNIDVQIDQDSNQVVLPLSVISADQIGEAAKVFGAVIQEGDVVALERDDLLPIVLVSRSLTYATNEHLAAGLGPIGSEIEFVRRQDRINDAVLQDSEVAVGEMCADNVRWLITSSDPAPSYDQGDRLERVATTDNLTLVRLNCN